MEIGTSFVPANLGVISGYQAACCDHASETSALTSTDGVTLSGAKAPAAPAGNPTPPADAARTTEVAVALSTAGPAAAVAAETAAASAPKPADMTEKLKALLPDRPFVITAERAAELQKATGLDSDGLLQALVPVAKEMARPPISNYLVGAAGLGKSGQIYLGVNLEFPGNALNQTVHGEQFVVTNALRNGEEQLTSLAVSAAPCGHCRQWLNETTGAPDLRILTPQQPPTPLNVLLPASFGPGDLGVTGALLSRQDQKMELKPGADMGDPILTAAAFEAANTSYAPYSKEGSGVAVRLQDGTVYTGRYSENAAFNPSLSPFQGALIGMVADKREFSEIQDVVLVERDGARASQKPATQTLLRSLGSDASFTVAYAEANKP